MNVAKVPSLLGFRLTNSKVPTNRVPTSRVPTCRASTETLNVPAEKMNVKYESLNSQHGADSCNNTRAKNRHIHDYEYGANTDEYNAENELSAGENRPVAQFVKNLQKRFKVKTKDVSREFIGIEIDQDSANQQIKLHQSKHIQDAVDQSALKDAKAVTIPINTVCLKDFNSKPLKGFQLLVFQESPFRLAFPLA